MQEFFRCAHEVLQAKKDQIVEAENDKEMTKQIFSGFLETVCRYISTTGGFNFRYDPENTNHPDKSCFICKKEFQKFDLCRTPDCEHLFHAVCICGLEDKATGELYCPICNTKIEDKIKFPKDFSQNV